MPPLSEHLNIRHDVGGECVVNDDVGFFVISQPVSVFQLVQRHRICALDRITGQRGGTNRLKHQLFFHRLRGCADILHKRDRAAENQRKHNERQRKTARGAVLFLFHANLSFRSRDTPSQTLPEMGRGRIQPDFYRMLEMMPAIGSITDSSTAPMTMDSAATMVGSMMETRLEMPSSTCSS